MTTTPISADEAKQAFKDGILDKIRDLAKQEAINEATEPGDVAEAQCARGMRLAIDAQARGFAEIDKIF